MFNELFNSNEIANNCKFILQELPNNLYVELECRNRPIANTVYVYNDLIKLGSYRTVITDRVAR